VPVDGQVDRPLLEQTPQKAPPLVGDEDFPTLVADMRGWKGNRAIIRSLLLLAHLDRIGGHKPLELWLEKSNLLLAGARPIDVIAEGKWGVVSDLVDEMLTGRAIESPEPSDVGGQNSTADCPKP
jgi:hypothetical protein